MDRYSQYAIAASEQAMRDAGLDLEQERPRAHRGHHRQRHRGHRDLRGAAPQADLEGGPDRISPFFVPMMIADIAAGLVSIRYGLKGPNYCTVSACASSAHAIGERLPQRSSTATRT